MRPQYKDEATQKQVTLSVIKIEQPAAVTCAKDMIYQKQLLECIDSQVELPVILQIYNQGAVDLTNPLSTGAS